MKDIAGATKEVRNLVQENIKSAVAEKRYNDDVQPVDWENMQKVTPDFVFLTKNPIKILGGFLARGLAMFVSPILCKAGIGTAKVHGRENLKGLKGAVITCNHVHIFDNLFVRWGTRGHKLYITVAEFNNMKGPLGALLRGAGCLPFSDCFTAMKNMSKAIDKLIQKGRFVLYYPEKAMWPRYEKPRPYINGAFHACVNNNVPVVPTFIAFKPKAGKGNEGKTAGEYYIMKPIYPKPELSKKENVEYLKNATFEAVCQCYKEVFGEDPYNETPVSVNL